MNQELRNSFSLILKCIMNKNGFDDATKDQIEDAGFAMMDLKKIAEHFCGADQYEMLSLVINVTKDSGDSKIDVDEHIRYCKLVDIWHKARLDISLLDNKQ